MKNRLFKKIQEAREKKTKLFCAFLTLGYPSLHATERLIQAFEKEGVDMLELGFPFSDPLADGPTIQYASEYSLRRGIHLKDAFALVRRLRKKGCAIPILFFTYLNPVYRYGFKRFAAHARQSGFDGLIVPDLPPGEETQLEAECRRQGLAQVFLAAPTTGKKRARLIGSHSQGFVYYVSLRGVTGARKNLPGDIPRSLVSIKRSVRKPVLIGFGVSDPAQARKLSRMSAGVIVGSAIVERLRHSRGNMRPVIDFVKRMVKAAKNN